MKYSSTLFSMPRPAFTRRKPMPAENRAAQFAPFAALTGYEEEIREVCRFTDSRRLPGEDLQAELERNLNLALQIIKHICCDFYIFFLAFNFYYKR